MSSIKFVFSDPWYLLFLIPAIEIICIPFFMQKKERRRSFRKIAPLVLHLVISVILVFIMAGFSVVRTTDEQAVVIVADLSHSTEGVRDMMKEHVETLLDTIDRTTPVGVVAFGGDAMYDLTLDSLTRKFSFSKVDEKATDIESAVKYAISKAPEDRAVRIILMTDGKQTEGKAENIIYNMSSGRIRLDGVYYDTTVLSSDEVQISSFSAGEGGMVGEDVNITAEIQSNYDGEVGYIMKDGENVVDSGKAVLVNGRATLSFTVVPQSEGLHTFSIEILPDRDTRSENNKMTAFSRAADKKHVLIVTSTPLNEVKFRDYFSKNYVVKTVLPYEAPKDIIGLCDYDQVILSNVDYYDMPNGFETYLESYVSVYGRSLFLLGGSNTFMYGNMTDTVYERMSPVSYEFTEETGNKVALMLVLDCSSSMGGNNRYLTIAKQGAVKCIEAMGDSDYVGIVSFDKEATLESSLMQSNAANKEILTRVVAGLKTGSGTYYTEAVKIAKEQLLKSDADVKHIIFLSDGQPSDNGYFEEVIDASENGITVSTIGLGYSSHMLENMAYYGKGRYYYVSSADDLPYIMLSETEQSRISSYIVGDFIPQILGGEIADGIGDDVTLPILGGYLGCTIREEAEMYISTEEGHPIYATWSYGFGKVSTFTSDWFGDWSGDWMASELGQRLVDKMVELNSPRVHNDSSISFSIDCGYKTGKVTVNTADIKTDSTVEITVTKDGKEKTYKLEQAYKSVFVGSVDFDGEGVYNVKIVQTGNLDKKLDTLDTNFTVSYPKEYDAYMADGKNLLAALCNRMGGEIFDDMEALAGVEGSEVRLTYQPVFPLSLIALILLIADIAIRKLRWKDVREQFEGVFGKKKG